MSTEAKLTSHLSISYSAAPTASGTPAAASGTAAPGAAAAEPDKSGAGFLAALIDQLLAGAAAPDATATTATTDDTAAATPAPFGATIDPAALTVVQSTVPRGNILLKQLAQGMQALQDELDKGETPDPALLKRLGDLADAIAAMINVSPPAVAPAIDPNLALDPLASIGQSSDKPKTGGLAGLADTNPPAMGQSPTVPDNVAQFLASLGLQLPASAAAAIPGEETGETAVAATAPSQPLPGIAQLADRLAALTQTIAAASPELAQKLAALAKKLDAAEATPQALAQLTVGSDTEGTELDRIVQALMSAKPAGGAPTTTALAAKTELPTPAPIVRTDAPLDAPQAPPTLAEAPASAPGPTKPTLAVRPVDTASDDAKSEAKIVAAATATVDSKPTDSSDTATQQNGVAAVAQAASAATPRAIPAAYQAASSPINMGQVAFEMVRQVHQGTSRFSFRIDPPELGRVDVRMHVDASGTVNARLTVERSETLDMFQRDRGALEKALSQAGLDSGKTNLEFSLKQNQQNPFAGLTGGDQRPGNSNSGSPFSLASGAGDDDVVPAVPSITLYRGIASTGGVNLFV